MSRTAGPARRTAPPRSRTRRRSTSLSPLRQGTHRFTHEGFRLAYTVYGDGPRTVVLLHGLMLSQRMHEGLAASLVERGNRVVTLDLLGHGLSDQPLEPACYSMGAYAEQVIALLDHLGLPRCAVGGTSLGANVTLEMAARAPRRLTGMVLEMPVLDNAAIACALVFGPLAALLTGAQPLLRAAGWLPRRLPRTGGPALLQVVLDVLRRDPAPGSALLKGLIFSRIAPSHAERMGIDVPALVLGHPRDPIHPFSDADMLVAELPRARLLEAESMVELRLRPQRLTAEIGAFLRSLPV